MVVNWLNQSEAKLLRKQYMRLGISLRCKVMDCMHEALGLILRIITITIIDNNNGQVWQYKPVILALR